ncbi:unnamed protein product, partial [Hapterophycus canaliculatus]
QDLFKDLIRYLDAADLRILSAFKSYVYLRHKSDTAERMSPIARAAEHQATVAQADAAAARISGWDGSGAGGRRGLAGRCGGVRSSGNGMGTYKRRQSSPGRVPYLGGGGGGGSGGGGGKGRGAGAAGGDEDALSEVTVPVSLINIVVHADQRRARLRMFHFADALPSLPPPPPPPPAHNTPSPRLLRPRGATRGGVGGVGRAGGGGSRDSGEIRQLPTTKEGVATGRDGAATPGRDGAATPGERGSGEEPGKKDGEREGQDPEGDGGAPAVRRCATCEALPVVQIDGGKGGTAEGTAGGAGGKGSTEGGGRGRAVSVPEGDLSANEQV